MDPHAPFLPYIIVVGQFDWMHGNAYGTDSLSGTNVASDSYQLTGYGTYHTGPAFIDGLFGIGYNHFDQSRAIDFLGTTAQANYGGFQYMTRIDGGWNFPVTTRTTFTPMVGFQATRTDTYGYTETGAGAADLAIGRQIIDSYATTLGGEAETVLPTRWGALKPEARLAWVHDLNNNAIPTNGTLGGVNFSTTTPRISPDWAQIALGTTLQTTSAVSFSIEYDGDIRPGFLSNTGFVKGTWGF